MTYSEYPSFLRRQERRITCFPVEQSNLLEQTVASPPLKVFGGGYDLKNSLARAIKSSAFSTWGRWPQLSRISRRELGMAWW